MTLVAVLLATALFFAGLQRAGLVERSWSIVTEAGAAVVKLRDRSLDDDAREALAQKLAVWMFGQFGLIAVLSAAVCAAPVALLAALVMSGATDSDAIWELCTSWPFIAGNVVLFVLVLVWNRRT